MSKIDLKKIKKISNPYFFYIKSGLFARNANNSPKKHTDIHYYYNFRKHIDWNNPKTLAEKLCILKCGIYRNNSLICDCTDKYKVRDYVTECGLADTLNTLYYVWDDVEEINTNSLPDSFVIKRNNDCGGIVVVKDKNSYHHLERDIQRLKTRMNPLFGLEHAEFHYQYISPVFICERYMSDPVTGGFPNDYKFFVMNGIARYALICVGRDSNLLRFIVDRDFVLFSIMPDEKQVTNEEIQKYKPELFDDMILIAEKLAKPFPFVRVDLYQNDNKIVFGELTFTPMGGVNAYFSPLGQETMGKLLDISEENFSERLKSADRRIEK